MKRIIKKSFSLSLIFAYTFVFILQDAEFSFAKEYASAASAGNQFSGSISAVQSFQPDLFTGRASLAVPITLPAGRQNVQPALTLSYSSSGTNSWVGTGWGLDLGVISRSTKNGVPKYDNSDTYVFSFQGVNSELVCIGGQEYRAKDEGAFLRFIFDGRSWDVYDKSGIRYTFGTSEAVRQTNASGTYSWHLDKAVDTNGNYFVISYQRDSNQVYPFRIEWTGHESLPVELPYYAVDFILEDRPDRPRDFRSGYEVVTAKRLKEITIKLGAQLARKYILNYAQSRRTSRSLLTSVTQYGSDGVSALPPVTFSYRDELDTTYDIYNRGAGVAYFQFTGDYNGDSRFDFLEFWTDGTWKASLSQGSSFTPAAVWLSGYGNPDPPKVIGDYNGDGKADICVYNNEGLYSGDWRVALSTGSNFTDSGFWITDYGMELSPISGDFNGDGLSDIGTYNSSNGEWKAAFSTGVSFSDKGVWMSGFGASGDKPLIGDFNGDGLTDIAIVNTAQGNISCALSDGTKFLPPAQWVRGFGLNKTHITSDFDNDGLTDAGYLDQTTRIIHYCPSDGFSFGAEREISAGFSLSGGTLYFQSGDFNGDGLTDPVIIRESDLQFQIGLSRGDPCDVVSSLNNGIGGVSTVTYEPSSSYDNTGEDDLSDLPFVIQTVKAITVSDGMGNSYTTNYSYSGGKYNAATRDFLGFGYAKVTDVEGNYSETYFKQEVCLKGMPDRQETKDAAGNLYGKVTNEYVTVEPYNGVHYSKLVRSDSFIYDGDASYKQTCRRLEYDSYGNVTVADNDGDVETIGDERRTVTSYTYNTGNWILNKPAVVALYDDESNKISEKKFYYDGNSAPEYPPVKGNLTKEEIWLDTGPVNPATTYAYDEFGNVLQATDAMGRSITNVYDPVYHAYLVGVTNVLGHTITYDYDYLLGLVTAATDTNGVSSFTEYDVFGRTVKAINPYDTSALPSVSYEYDFSAFPVKVTTRSRQISGSTEVGVGYAFYDGLGRKIQTRVPAEDPEKQIVSGAVTYTAKGEVKESYQPYFEGASDSYIASNLADKPKVTYTYDAAGRVIHVLNPDSTCSSVQYDDWVRTSIDENGVRKRYTSDASGRLIKVEEFNGSEVYTTVYEYDGQGNLVKLTDALGNITVINYDSLGRKTGMSDPDMGDWSYSYDLLGNLISQTDAKGQTLSFEYDLLNRLAKKSALTGGISITLAEYFYDDTNKENSLGRLSKVTYAGGSTEFFYDKLGREIKSVKVIDGVSYAVERQYDNLSRLTEIMYPDGSVVRYTYNAAGAIETVRDGDNFYLLGADYSPSGQMTRINYGNGATTEYSYDADTLRLMRLTTRGASLELLQDKVYSYDAIGSITRIEDMLYPENSQDFAYDDLNRLISARGGYGDYGYEYDAIGNIIDKEGKDYTYLSGKPHAVTGLSDGTVFTYDANGNMAQKIEKGNPGLRTSYTYDRENRLVRAEFPRIESITLNLSEGWNFVSVPVIPEDNAITSVIPDFGEDIDQISRYNAQEDKFEHFVNDAKYDDFVELDYGHGYEIYVQNPSGVVLTIQGKVPTDSVLAPIHPGSNLIGSITLDSAAPSWLVNNLITGLDYDNIWRYDKGASSYELLTQAQGKEGYFLHSIREDAVEWEIPSAQENAISFAYDGDGGRVKKVDGSGSTIYIGSLYEVVNGAAKKHIFMGGQRVAVKSSTGTEYYHADHLGSANVLTNAEGAQIQRFEYKPYGSLSKNESANQQTGQPVNHLFTGKELDDSGLYYFGARYYDPDLGRFITADPTIQRPTDPQDMNRYAYCRNNPVNLIDPTGYGWKSFWKKVGDFFKKEVLAPLISAVVAVASFGILAAVTPMVMTATTAMVIGSSAAATTAVLDTGEGRQLIQRVGNEFFDDVLGMSPSSARTASSIAAYMAVNAGFQSLFGNLVTGGERVTSRDYKYNPNNETSLDVQVRNILKQGEGFNYGSAPKGTEDVSRVLFNRGGDLVGIANKANIFMLGAQHTGVVMSDIPSISGTIQLKHFPNMSNLYGLWGISHQAVNVSLLEAGYASTIMSVGGGWTTAVSTVIYGPYGGGATGTIAASQVLKK